MTRLLLALVSFATGCGSGVPFPLAEDATATAMITPAAGGAVMAATGDALVVPPGAVAEDVEITLTPLALAGVTGASVFAGARLAPDGLEFQTPATLTLALAAPQEPGSTLKVGKGYGTLTEFGDAQYTFTVDASGMTATGLVYGFSGACLMKRCHAGTRDHLLRAWQGIAGRDAASLAQELGVTLDEFQSCQFDEAKLQQVLSKYFDKCAERPTGDPFDDTARAAVESTLAAGREVVFLFGGEQGGLAYNSGQGAFDGVAHSAVAVQDGGRIVVRNQLNLAVATQAELRQTRVDMPLDEIDQPGAGLRDQRAGEAYSRIKGQDFPNRERRPRAWSHVVALCEKPRPGQCPEEALPNGSCNGGSLWCIGSQGVSPCPGGGAVCCPADMCEYYGQCVQIACPEGIGRNYDCECCCTAGMGEAGSCNDTATVRNVWDECRSDRLLGCEAP